MSTVSFVENGKEFDVVAATVVGGGDNKVVVVPAPVVVEGEKMVEEEEALGSVEGKCGFHGLTRGQEVGNVPMFTEEINAGSECKSGVGILSLVQLPVSQGSEKTSLDDHPYSKFIDLQLETANSNLPCTLDIAIDIGSFENPKFDDEAIRTIKTSGVLTGLLQRQTSIKTCRKLMHFLTTYSATLLKLASQGMHMSRTY